MNPHLVLASLTLAITLCYTALCVAAPWGRCRRCHGHGRKPGHNHQPTRAACRRCRGTGRRVRIGRRIWTFIDREYRHGTR